MKQIVARAEELMQLVQLHNHLVGEAILVIDGDRIECKTIGPSHVAARATTMTVASLAGDVGREEHIIDLDILKDILRLALPPSSEEGCMVTLRFDEVDMHVTVGSAAMRVKKPSGAFTVPKMPNLSYAVEVTAAARDAAEAIRWVENFTDHFYLDFDGTKAVAIRGDGDTRGLVYSLACSSINARGHGKQGVAMVSIYSADYVRAALGAMQKAGNLRLSFGTDSPLRIQGSWSNAGTTVDTEFVMAPRIHN